MDTYTYKRIERVGLISQIRGAITQDNESYLLLKNGLAIQKLIGWRLYYVKATVNLLNKEIVSCAA